MAVSLCAPARSLSPSPVDTFAQLDLVRLDATANNAVARAQRELHSDAPDLDLAVQHLRAALSAVETLAIAQAFSLGKG